MSEHHKVDVRNYTVRVGDMLGAFPDMGRPAITLDGDDLHVLDILIGNIKKALRSGSTAQAMEGVINLEAVLNEHEAEAERAAIQRHNSRIAAQVPA